MGFHIFCCWVVGFIYFAADTLGPTRAPTFGPGGGLDAIARVAATPARAAQ